MKEALTLCSNLFIVFFSSLGKELNHFFENKGSTRHPRNQKEFYKIPRLGR